MEELITSLIIRTISMHF